MPRPVASARPRIPPWERHVRVGDPCHLTRAGAVVGRRHVEAGADEVFLDQLRGVAPRDLLDLVHRVLLGVDGHAALGPAERHVDDRTFVGHERRERLDLVLVDLRCVADAALDRRAVVAVMHAPAGDDLVLTALAADRKLHRVDGVRHLDLIEQAARVIAQRRGFFEVDVDGLEEARGTRVRYRHGEMVASRRFASLVPISEES
jgi:hypothetical protein